MEINDLNISLYYFRHGSAKYEHIIKTLDSKNPEKIFMLENYNKLVSDLTSQALNEVSIYSEKFFSNLNSEKDLIIIASSPEARTLETGRIFKEAARRKGFEIVDNKKVGLNRSQKANFDDKIIVLKALGPQIKSPLIIDIFTQYLNIPELGNREEQINGKGYNWDIIRDGSKEFKQKWIESKRVVLTDDKGEFGSNFLAHSREVKKIFGKEIVSIEDVYNKSLKNLITLYRVFIKNLLNKKIDINTNKKIHLIVFGHEELVLWLLQTNFGINEFVQTGKENSEPIKVLFNGKGIEFSFKGKTKQLNDMFNPRLYKSLLNIFK